MKNIMIFVLLKFIIFTTIFCENGEVEIKERLENIIFDRLEESGIIDGIAEVKKLSFNREYFAIILFKTGRKLIIKNKKTLTLEGIKYTVTVGKGEMIEFKTDENQVFFLKAQ